MIHPFFHFEPNIAQSAYVDARALVIGQVALGEKCSVWPGAVLRGDINSITVGDYSNIQDNSVLHVGDAHAVEIANEVVVGHAARIHGCTIKDGCLVGIGAVVLNGAVVEEGCILAAGTLVPENTVLRAGHLYMGAPARERRALDKDEIEGIRRMAHKYAFIAEAHRRNAAAIGIGQVLGRGDWEALYEEMKEHLRGI